MGVEQSENTRKDENLREYMSDIFVDGIKNVAVQGPIARIELANFAGTSGSDEDKILQTKNRLVMPVETMIRLQQSLTQVMSQLEEKGLIKRKDADAEETVSAVGEKGKH